MEIALNTFLNELYKQNSLPTLDGIQTPQFYNLLYGFILQLMNLKNKKNIH